MPIAFDSPEISVVVTRLSGDRVMSCWTQASSRETVRDFLLRHENVLGGESAAPAEILTLVNLDAQNAEPFQHDQNFFDQIVSSDRSTDEPADEFSSKVQMIGCVPLFVTREVRLFVGIRADASGLLIPALTVHPKSAPDRLLGSQGERVELNYQGARLRFFRFEALFTKWCGEFLESDLSKPAYQAVPPLYSSRYLKYREREIISVMRPKVFAYILRNWILTHSDELSSSADVMAMARWGPSGDILDDPMGADIVDDMLAKYPLGADILAGLVDVCFWPTRSVRAPSCFRRKMSKILPAVINALEEVGMLEEHKSRLSDEEQDMIDWQRRVFFS